MKLSHWTACAAFTAAALTLMPAASAADTANAKLADCISMAKQVSVALTAAQPSSTTDAARTEASAARSFCSASMYSRGVASYSRALQLLGKG